MFRNSVYYHRPNSQSLTALTTMLKGIIGASALASTVIFGVVTTIASATKTVCFWFVLSLVFITASNAHAATVSYTLNDVFLDDGTQMTGAFDWTYTIDDFEGGSGVFTALAIPYRPIGSVPPLEEGGMIFTIETKQIEITLDNNFHDYGLDIILKFLQPLSPTQPSLIDLATSKYECCGNGFENHLFKSGSITPVAPVPLPAALPLLGGALSLLGFLGWRRKRMAA